MLTVKQRIVWCILHLLWVLPIKKNRIAFLCYNCTQYTCNPKYISEYLQKTYGDAYELVWYYAGDAVSAQIPPGIKKYKRKSAGYYLTLMTAGMVISNVTLPRVVPFRKAQLKINTWHGTAFKGDNNKHGNRYNRFDVFLAENHLTETVLRRKDSFNYMGKIAQIGMPRNDILIRRDQGVYSCVKEKLGIPEDTKIVLYAPTFRENSSTDCFNIDFEKLVAALSRKWGGTWTVLFRYHHMQENKVYMHGGLDVTDYPDMQHLLLVSDLLITDYSSTMWDFSLMAKPVILYATDIDHYVKDERGDFYYPLSKLPFGIAQSNDQLLHLVDSFDPKSYAGAVEQYHRALGRYNLKGNATERFAQTFLHKI